jgi:hypothetical protein
MVNVLATAQNVNNDFTALGSWIGVCTGPPGTTSTVLNEAHGGTPTAYARQETTWTSGTNGSASGSPVTLNLPAGTYPYMIMCQSSSGNTLVDWCILPTPIMVTSQAAIQVTPSTSTA